MLLSARWSSNLTALDISRDRGWDGGGVDTDGNRGPAAISGGLASWQWWERGRRWRKPEGTRAGGGDKEGEREGLGGGTRGGRGPSATARRKRSPPPAEATALASSPASSRSAMCRSRSLNRRDPLPLLAARPKGVRPDRLEDTGEALAASRRAAAPVLPEAQANISGVSPLALGVSAKGGSRLRSSAARRA